LQDTFYLSDPVKSLSPPRDYYERISRVHEHGGYGSVGYHAPWSDAESHKLLLRTHTTASSAHMLYKLAARCRGETPKDSEVHDVGVTSSRVEREPNLRGDGFRPAKLFSIDRVFRNETMDATHLAEFHQVEGVVADRGLTLADLIGPYAFFYGRTILTMWHAGFMRVFFKKMGIENLRFKPAYNPYTEVRQFYSAMSRGIKF
jgi:phenylalanyl-tRNA synthetase alpha chain